MSGVLPPLPNPPPPGGRGQSRCEGGIFIAVLNGKNRPLDRREGVVFLVADVGHRPDIERTTTRVLETGK